MCYNNLNRMNFKQKLGIAVFVVASSLGLAFVWVATNNSAEAATLTSITFQTASQPATSTGSSVLYFDGSSLKLSTGGAFSTVSTGVQWTTSGANIYNANSGNVGIGTTTAPAYPLTVNGNIGLLPDNSVITGSKGLTLQETGDVFGTVSLSLQNRNGMNGALFSNPSIDLVDFAFLPNSLVQQNIRYEHRAGSIMGSGNTNGEFQIGVAGNPNLVVGSSTTAVRVGSFGVGTTAPTTAKLVISPGAQPSIDAGSQKIINVATPTTSTDAANRAYVDSVSGGFWTASSTSIYNNNAGNVGIGTTNPGYKLEVALGSNQTMRLGTPSTASAVWFTNGGILSQASEMQLTTHASAINFYTGGTRDTMTPGTSRMIINNAGNIGIGTTTPAYLLDVNGTARVTQLLLRAGGNVAGTANGPVIYSQDSTLSGRFYNGAIYLNGALFVKNDADSVINMVVDDAGNVGIGTTTAATSPATKLVVDTATANDGIYLGNGDTQTPAWLRQFGATLGAGAYNPLSVLGDSGLIYSAGTVDTGGLIIAPWSNSAGGIRMNASGQVGIGTATPAATLDVNGAIALKGITTLQYSTASSSFAAGPNAGGLIGLYNTGVGINALQNTSAAAGTTGSYNTGVGFGALINNISGSNNTAVGYNTLGSNQYVTSDNTALGFNALVGSRANQNTAVGSGAISGNNTGYANTAVGLWALHNNTTGNQNIAIGSSAGYYNTTGSNNSYLGGYTGYATSYGTSSNNIFLSDGVGNLRMRIDSAGNFYYGAAGTTLGTAIYIRPNTSTHFACGANSCDGGLSTISTCTTYTSDAYGACVTGTQSNNTFLGRLTQ